MTTHIAQKTNCSNRLQVLPSLRYMPHCLICLVVHMCRSPLGKTCIKADLALAHYLADLLDRSRPLEGCSKEQTRDLQ